MALNQVTSGQFIVVLSDLSWNMLVQSGIPNELKITGTLPEAENLKPNIRWNYQAPAKKTRAVFWRT